MYTCGYFDHILPLELSSLYSVLLKMMIIMLMWQMIMWWIKCDDEVNCVDVVRLTS